MQQEHYLSSSSSGISIKDSFLNFMQLSVKYKFSFQSHKIYTQDQYILTIFRIKPKIPNGKVVFLQHGLTACADIFVCNGLKLSPAFILSENGFDVWLGNNRGNIYSIEHQQLNPDMDDEYWDFSFEEMGRYDLVACFKYIQDKTQNKINYIGISQATSQILLLMSQQQQLVKQLCESVTLVAPVTSLKNTSKIRKLASHLYLPSLIYKINKKSIFNRNQYLSTFLNFLCDFCPQLFHLISNRNINNEMLSVILAHAPSGSSVKSYLHFAQIIRNGRFSLFDYGQQVNLQKYNSLNPPQINLCQIKQSNCPKVCIVAGTQDNVVKLTDVWQVMQILKEGNIVKKYIEAQMSHHSFSFAKDVNYLKEVMDFIK